MYRVAPICLIVAVLSVGCQQNPPDRLNAPPQGTANPNEHPLKENQEAMVDNGMMEDLAIGDHFFVPHTDVLSNLGHRRIERFARLLVRYGGTLRYDTDLSDRALLRQRMESVRELLTDVGIEEGRIEVTQDLPGGRGMDAAEAIVVRQRMHQPDQEGGGDLMGDIGKMLGGK